MDLLQIKSLVDAGVKVLYDESHAVIKNDHGDYFVIFMGTASSMPLQLWDPAGPFGQHALNGHEWAFTVAAEEFAAYHGAHGAEAEAVFWMSSFEGAVTSYATESSSFMRALAKGKAKPDERQRVERPSYPLSISSPSPATTEAPMEKPDAR